MSPVLPDQNEPAIDIDLSWSDAVALIENIALRGPEARSQIERLRAYSPDLPILVRVLLEAAVEYALARASLQDVQVGANATQLIEAGQILLDGLTRDLS